MSLVMERIEAPCPKNIGGPHLWQVFGGGVGCSLCEAWRPREITTVLLDPLPTTAILRPPGGQSTYGEPVDQSLDVMNDLLEIARPDVSWVELEAMANRIIERIRA